MTDQIEPMHARFWQKVRIGCERRTGAECRYPWCRCLYLAASVDDAKDRAQSPAPLNPKPDEAA